MIIRVGDEARDIPQNPIGLEQRGLKHSCDTAKSTFFWQQGSYCTQSPSYREDQLCWYTTTCLSQPKALPTCLIRRARFEVRPDRHSELHFSIQGEKGKCAFLAVISHRFCTNPKAEKLYLGQFPAPPTLAGAQTSWVTDNGRRNFVRRH